MTLFLRDFHSAGLNHLIWFVLELESMKKFGNIRLSHFLKLASGSDIWIMLVILLLAVGGLLMIGSASMGLAIGNNVSLIITVLKQFIYIMAGYVLMCYASHHFTLKFIKSTKFFDVMVVMEILLLICRVFTPAGGAYAWIRIPLPKVEMTIQPSEFTKIIGYLIIAAYLGDINRKKLSFRQLVRMPVISIGAYVFTIVFIQHDFGSAAVLFIIVCVCYLIPRHRALRKSQTVLKILFWVAVAGVVFLISPYGMSFIESLPMKTYQKNRFLSAINPFIDQYGDGYQLVNGLVAFASGGLFGVGFGKSIRKYTNFPAANTDFILAVLVEETGFAGFCVLMFLYTFLIVRLFLYAAKIHSEKARIVLVGTAMYFMVHIFLNVGGVTGLIPLTGVPLPLFSAGGSSAMSMMLSVGLCQGIISSYHRGEIV